MEENKREQLAKLYALRAGVCALSAECGKIRCEDERAMQVRVRIEDNTAELLNYDSIVSTSKKTYKNAKQDYNKTKREYDKKSFPLLCFMIAMISFAVAAIYVYHLRSSVSENTALYDIAVGALGIAATYSALRAAFLGRKVKPLKKKMRHLRDLMRDSKTWISESESGALVVKEENRELVETRRDMDASRDSVSAIAFPFATALRDALSETFSELVSDSYYGALDFIIYEIKCGAADDIPAALLAADVKKKTDALEEAVRISHEKINFAKDTEELSEEISATLSVLEEKLTDKLDYVLSKIERSRISDFGGSEAVRNELKKSCSAKRIFFALSECAERTSMDVALDMQILDENKK